MVKRLLHHNSDYWSCFPIVSNLSFAGEGGGSWRTHGCAADPCLLYDSLLCIGAAVPQTAPRLLPVTGLASPERQWPIQIHAGGGQHWNVYSVQQWTTFIVVRADKSLPRPFDTITQDIYIRGIWLQLFQMPCNGSVVWFNTYYPWGSAPQYTGLHLALAWEGMLIFSIFI